MARADTHLQGEEKEMPEMKAAGKKTVKSRSIWLYSNERMQFQAKLTPHQKRRRLA